MWHGFKRNLLQRGGRPEPMADWLSATTGHMLNKAGFMAPSATWVKTGSCQPLKN